MPYYEDEDLALILGVGSVHDVSARRTRKKKEPIGFKLTPPEPPKAEEPPPPKPKRRRKRAGDNRR